MSDDEDFHVVVTSLDALKSRMVVAYTHAMSLIQNGQRVEVKVGPAHDPITALQRAFLHGAVLPQIAEQVYVEVDGKRGRYTADLWKPFFFKLFVKPKFAMRRLPGAKRATPYRTNPSSENLGVRAYSLWIDSIIDWAILEHGVVFVFRPGQREEVRWVAKPKRSEQQ